MTAKIKLCGLSRPVDIDYVNQAKPDYCGFIVNFPKSRRNVTPEQVRALTARLSGDIIPVGVFVDESVERMGRLPSPSFTGMRMKHTLPPCGS